MSLPRASYLESWEYNPFRQRPQNPASHDEDSDDDDDLHPDLPDSAASSSFPSTISHRLSFNPYAGPGWRRGSVEDANDEQYRHGYDPGNVDVNREGELEPQRIVFKEPDWNVPLTTGAFEVGRVKRIAQVCIAIVYCFLAAGIVFGFAAIKPVLIQEDVYRHLCSKEEMDERVNVCYGQEIRLNLMFTIAAVATNVSALPVGTILDIYGPRVCGIIGSFCLAMGAILFGLAKSLPFDAYILGYFLLSLGGPFVFISSFHLSNTFPTRSGLILSMLTGAFDASSALFLIFRLVNERTHGAFSVKRFFTVYLLVPLFIMIVQMVIMPTTSYKTAGELVQAAEAHISDEANDRVDATISDPREGERQRNDRRLHRQSVVSQIQDLLDSGDFNENENETYYSKVKGYLFGPDNATSSTPESDDILPPPPQPQRKPPNMHPTGSIWGALHGQSALNQILSPWFTLITAFTTLQMLRINYFVATINQQYTSLLSSPEQAKHINQLFDFLLPLGGLVSVPFIGTLLDTLSTPLVLSILVMLATLIGILGCIPHNLPAAYGNIILFVLYRPFYYTSISDYAAKVFGFQTFGKVYGLIICIAGLGNFLQAGLDALTFKVFGRDPVPVNAFLAVLGAALGGVLVGFVSWRARAMAAATGDGGDVGENGAAVAVSVSECVPAGEGDGVGRRDWEREPLLSRQIGNGNGDEAGYGGVGRG